MVKGKVLLLKLETGDTFPQASGCMPFGIMYIADAVRRAGYDVEIFHTEWNANFQKRLLEKVSDDTVLVGFSTLTNPSLGPTVQASRLLKKNFPSLLIVWGGVHASLLPIQTLQNDFVDIVVIGEGEDTLGEVADATIKQNGLKKVNGIGYKKNGLVKLTKSRRWLELDKYAPAWDLIDARRYFTRLGSKRRAFSIVTSRGCPHQCTFCYNVAFNRMTWRAHSTSYVVSQISMLNKKLGIDAIYFQDDNFFTDKQRAYKILEKIKLPWYAEVRADYLTRKDVEKMEQLNCQRLLIGAESGSPRILKEIVKKDLKKEEIVRAVKLCKNKIPVSLSFIVGYPTESMEELGETMECVEQLLRIEAENVIDVNVLAPYPGTEIYNLLPDEFKPKSTEEWQYLTRKVISLPWLNQEQRKMINGMLIAAHYFHPGYSKTRANRLIQRMLRFRWRYKFFDFFLEPELIRLKENLFKWRVKQQKKIA